MSGTINVSPYPSTNRTHGVFGVIDPSGANSGQTSYPTLVVGNMLASGTATPGIPTLLPVDQDGIRTAFGAGSVVALKAARNHARDPIATIYVLPLLDDPAAVVASAPITISGVPTANGVVSLYVAGTLVPIAVTAGMTAAAIATALAAAINALADLPVTAATAAAVLTVTAKNKGLTGNDIDLRLNYQGAAAGEATPPGLAFAGVLSDTGTQLSGGQQNPTALQAALANLPAKPYDYIDNAWVDPTSLNVWQTFMAPDVGRWSWQSELYGHVFSGFRGTLSAAVSFGLTRNDPAMTILPVYDAPEPAWLWASDLAGTCAASLRADPGQPLQELTLGVLRPPGQARFDAIGERNTLLYAGMSTNTYAQDGTVVLDRVLTTYQTAPSGAPDTSYLRVQTRFCLMDLIRDMRVFLQTTYARKKLVADGSNIPGGSNATTSQNVLSSAWGRYRGYCDANRAQNYATFKANSRAQNAGNGQVNLLLPFDLPNELIAIVMKVNFVQS